MTKGHSAYTCMSKDIVVKYNTFKNAFDVLKNLIFTEVIWKDIFEFCIQSAQLNQFMAANI